MWLRGADVGGIMLPVLCPSGRLSGLGSFFTGHHLGLEPTLQSNSTPRPLTAPLQTFLYSERTTLFPGLHRSEQYPRQRLFKRYRPPPSPYPSCTGLLLIPHNPTITNRSPADRVDQAVCGARQKGLEPEVVQSSGLTTRVFTRGDETERGEIRDDRAR